MSELDLEHVKFHGYSPFKTKGECEFDHKAAWAAINFIERELIHVKGKLAGKPLILADWQKAIIGTVFGWKRKDGTRRYRRVYIELARKGGKSLLGAAIALILLYLDNEAGAEVYSCAGDRDQAGIVFDMAKSNVLRNEKLNSRSKIYRNSIVNHDRKTGMACGSYKVLSSDAGTKHGYSPSGVIFDELHVQPNGDLWEAMVTGTGARPQPLLVAITTAGWDRNSLCYQQHKLACSVRDDVTPLESFLPVIYAAADTDDWTVEATWRKAQPNLGVSVPVSFYEEECQTAQQNPAYENSFRRLYLSQWTEQDVRAIPMDKWDACGCDADPIQWRKEQLATLKNSPCVGGLDLGSTGDLTALVLLFGDCKPFTLLPFFWVPMESAAKRERRDHVPYPQWIKDGFIFPTPGTMTDYDKVRLDINSLADDYGIRELAVDRLFQGAQLCTQLGQDGLPIQAFGQSFLMFAAPTKFFLELIVSDGIRHGNNPVLRWMAANAATDDDAHENLKFDKKKSLERIDGIVASVMALGRVNLVEDAGYWNPSEGVSL